jgi:aminoglycoside 6'-N-acetyltransferase I
MERMKIRKVQRSDRAEWLRLRNKLWSDEPESHPREIAEFFEGRRKSRAEVYVTEQAAGKLCGFVEVSIREWADGCLTRHVGYIEGWYVERAFRRQGVGKQLVRAAETWAREKGCREMGSDCLIGNRVSSRAHRALGYQETERLIMFRKDLK